MYVDPFVFKSVVNETMNNCFIHRAFDDVECDGTVKLKKDYSLAFTHARKTTGDRPKTIAVLKAGQHKGKRVLGNSAGGLWKACTGKSIRKEECCVYNCTNPKCNPNDGKAQKAGATAHVYGRFQSEHIEYMILLPTCSKCNNWKQCAKTLTNHPLKGEEPAKTLYTVLGAQLMFIEISPATASGKGAAGKGAGDGGDFVVVGEPDEEEGSEIEDDEEGEEGADVGPPEGAQVIGAPK